MKSPKLRGFLSFPRRLVWFLLALLVMVFIIFAFWRVGVGDPSLWLGQNATPEQVETAARRLGLDEPLWRQCALYLGRTLRGDFGPSSLTGRPVVGEMRQLLPSTLRLLGFSVLIGMGLSLLIILLGVLVLAVRRKVPVLAFILPGLGQVGVSLGIAIPAFLLSLLLLSRFAFVLAWLPAGGWADLGSERSFDLRHAVLPALTLAILPSCLVARSVLGEIAQYWSSPASSRGALIVHAALSCVRNGLIQIVGMVGGAVLVEPVFLLPGIGRLLLRALQVRDFLMIHGLVYLFLGLALIPRAMAGLVQGVDGFAMSKLREVAPEAAAQTHAERPRYARVLGWLWIALCLLLVLVPLAQGIAGYLTGAGRVHALSVGDRNLPPGSESDAGDIYAWGTDHMGRDVRSRALYALGLNLGSSLLLALIVLIPALLGGVLTGFLVERGRIWTDLLDDLLMFPVDVLTPLPGLILLVYVLSVTGSGLRNSLVSMGLIFLLPRCVRGVRNSWIGAYSKGSIWRRLGGIVLSTLVFGTGLAFLTQLALGFLRLGVQPPSPDLGAVFAEGVQYMRMAPHVVLRPGWMLLTATLGWFLLADTLLSKFGIRRRETWMELNR